MIDIHSHILHGIDDGARSFEKSIEMLNAAKQDGITSIITTPHYSSGIYGKMLERLEKLRPEAAKLDIELHPGCEYDFSSLSRLESLISVGNDNKYVLIDFCSSFLSPMTKNFLFEWQSRGYTIIIAHPERLFSKSEIPVLKDFVESDIYFQLNAGSFRGDYGRGAKRMAKLLLKNGLCHFIGSDAHSIRNYNGQIPYCRKHITKRYGADMEKVIFEKNPSRLLAGNTLVSVW
jgi:protein-tyrosine phosphatase